ncbi:MAG TPA: hypothetical protein DEG09_06000 [Marinilabiliaceae bacterium]|jgi:lipopolysaccharide/colanic/teichoic acid biosynthesis glycosyltransferase|nr:hypothetical protein [Marinilabiliaceae bacterium]
METRKIQSFEDFKTRLINEPELQNQFKANPLEAVNQFEQQSPLHTDKWIYRIIVIALSVTIVLIIAGVLLLMASGKISDDQGVPTILTAVGSAAIGALAGLLAPSPK